MCSVLETVLYLHLLKRLTPTVCTYVCIVCSEAIDGDDNDGDVDDK